MFELKNVKNSRSLYGIKVQNGFIANKLFRSGRLDNITKEDIDIIRKNNITTVIDLRTIVEQSERPDFLIEGVNYYHIPILDEETLGITRDDKSRVDIFEMIKENAKDDNYAKEYMQNTYKELIKPNALKGYKEFFKVLLNSDGGALWHCSAGKDRAGVATIYVLLALGASKEDIIFDYMKTNEILKDENEIIIENVRVRHNNFIAEQIKDIFTCKKEYVEQIFATILNKYKDLNDFLLQEFDLDSDKLKKLKEKYCLVMK